MLRRKPKRKEERTFRGTLSKIRRRFPRIPAGLRSNFRHELRQPANLEPHAIRFSTASPERILHIREAKYPVGKIDCSDQVMYWNVELINDLTEVLDAPFQQLYRPWILDTL